MTDHLTNPVAAARWLVDHHPDTALAYAKHRAQKHVPTERGARWWDAVRANVEALQSGDAFGERASSSGDRNG